MHYDLGIGDLKMNRYLGDWMEKNIKPTEDEAIDLFLVVESTPYEFDYSCDDVLDKASEKGLNRIDVEFKAINKRIEMVR
jgi:hypothetical protein